MFLRHHFPNVEPMLVKSQWLGREPQPCPLACSGTRGLNLSSDCRQLGRHAAPQENLKVPILRVPRMVLAWGWLGGLQSLSRNFDSLSSKKILIKQTSHPNTRDQGYFSRPGWRFGVAGQRDFLDSLRGCPRVPPGDCVCPGLQPRQPDSSSTALVGREGDRREGGWNY